MIFYQTTVHRMKRKLSNNRDYVICDIYSHGMNHSTNHIASYTHMENLVIETELKVWGRLFCHHFPCMNHCIIFYISMGFTQTHPITQCALHSFYDFQKAQDLIVIYYLYIQFNGLI